MHTPQTIPLVLLPGQLSVCQLPAATELPKWARESSFSAVVRTQDELSVVCEQQLVPQGVKVEAGWRAIKVQGPLDFSLVGVISALAEPLAKAGISIFAISTYDTDYILIKETHLEPGLQALNRAGFLVRGYDRLLK